MRKHKLDSLPKPSLLLTINTLIILSLSVAFTAAMLSVPMSTSLAAPEEGLSATLEKLQQRLAVQEKRVAQQDERIDQQDRTIAEQTKRIAQQDEKIAELYAAKIIDEYAGKYPSAIKCFQEDFEACTQHMAFPAGHHKHIMTTNLLELPFGEQKRRTKIIPRFFDENS